LISHFYSSPPNTLTVDRNGTSRAEIFRTDFTGDGTIRDLLPGTQPGAFGRSISPENLNTAILTFNNTLANTLTPAGNALVSAGLFTPDQLVALGGAVPALGLAPQGNLGNGTLRTLDARLSYVIPVHGERFHIEPSVGFFNLANFSNFAAYATGRLEPLGRSAAPGTITGTASTADRVGLRTGNGTGTFAQGSPREIEYGLRITF
jgi:hypothetical protein